MSWATKVTTPVFSVLMFSTVDAPRATSSPSSNTETTPSTPRRNLPETLTSIRNSVCDVDWMFTSVCGDGHTSLTVGAASVFTNRVTRIGPPYPTQGRVGNGPSGSSGAGATTSSVQLTSTSPSPCENSARMQCLPGGGDKRSAW